MTTEREQLTEKLHEAEKRLAYAEAELKAIQPPPPALNSEGNPRLGDPLLPTEWPDLFMEVQGVVVPSQEIGERRSLDSKRKRREKTMIGGLRRITGAPTTTLAYRGMLHVVFSEFENYVQNVFIDHPVFEPATVERDNDDSPIDQAWTDFDNVLDTGFQTAVIGLKRTSLGFGKEEVFRLDLMICGTDEETALVDWKEIAARVRTILPYETAAHKVDVARKRRDTLKRKLDKLDEGETSAARTPSTT